MPETTVSPDLLQSLQIFSQLVIQTVGQDLKRDTADFSLNITPEFHVTNRRHKKNPSDVHFNNKQRSEKVGEPTRHHIILPPGANIITCSSLRLLITKEEYYSCDKAGQINPNCRNPNCRNPIE